MLAYGGLAEISVSAAVGDMFPHRGGLVVSSGAWSVTCKIVTLCSARFVVYTPDSWGVNSVFDLPPFPCSGCALYAQTRRSS